MTEGKIAATGKEYCLTCWHPDGRPGGRLFWASRGLRARQGRHPVVSGYAGGKADTATYDQVSSGQTGHAESVRITYDPARISYGKS